MLRAVGLSTPLKLPSTESPPSNATPFAKLGKCSGRQLQRVSNRLNSEPEQETSRSPRVASCRTVSPPCPPAKLARLTGPLLCVFSY